MEEGKRGLLDIDLNVAPPEDNSPAPEGENGTIGAHSSEEEEGKRSWNALLKVVEISSREYDEARLQRTTAGKKSRRRSWSDDCEVAVVARSTRGRAVAMPNKYRDSVLDAVAVAEAEAEFHRSNRHGKSGKRKSR